MCTRHIGRRLRVRHRQDCVARSLNLGITSCTGAHGRVLGLARFERSGACVSTRAVCCHRPPVQRFVQVDENMGHVRLPGGAMVDFIQSPRFTASIISCVISICPTLIHTKLTAMQLQHIVSKFVSVIPTYRLPCVTYTQRQGWILFRYVRFWGEEGGIVRRVRYLHFHGRRCPIQGKSTAEQK